jgi:SpoVK/Ycf46/Vps4 family AAA+-type ATPase
MIPLTGLMISENYGNYRTSKLREYLESGEFFADIGVATFEKIEEKTTTMPWGKKEESKKNSLSKEINRVLMGSHRIPYLVGHPGIGKTAIAKSINKNYLAYNISTFTPDRFTGKTALIPGKTKIITDENGVTYSEAIEPGTTSIALPDWYNDLCDMAKKCAVKGEKCVLFLDEFDKLTPNMQVFINGVVDTPRTIANLVIPDNVDIIFAGNTEEYSDASFNISGEVESRLTRIEVQADFHGWMSWAIKNNIDPLVRAYLLANKKDLVKDVTDSKGKYDYCKSLTPRSWDQKISEEIKISRRTGEYPKLGLYMSSDMESKFEEFMNYYFNLRIEDILNGTYGEVDTFAMDYSKFIEIANNLSVVVSNEEQLENAMIFIKQLNNPEIQTLFEKLWIKFNNTEEDIIMLREIKSVVFDESEVVRHG